jgi:hypothetical protein
VRLGVSGREHDRGRSSITHIHGGSSILPASSLPDASTTKPKMDGVFLTDQMDFTDRERCWPHASDVVVNAYRLRVACGGANASPAPVSSLKAGCFRSRREAKQVDHCQ